ncbi:3'-kinase, partial [Amaricoccus sp. HAR-UPW-R2A-40]
LFHKADEDNQADPSSIFIRGAAVARRLLAEDTPSYVLHGDLHHENIRHHPERGWLAIDPKGLYGDRAYDAANALCNPGTLPEIDPEPRQAVETSDDHADALDITRERLLSYVFAHACLS